MLAILDQIVQSAHRRRWAHFVVVNLRILVGFAFVPAGLKKVLDQPFTDPGNTGAFHEFLHAFRATGAFYQLVGVLQLAAALLLMSQRFALAGAAIALPILTAIVGLCWSTGVYPTATIATLMWLAIVALIAWEWPRWRGAAAAPPLVELRAWQACGAVILALYGGLCVATSEVYRPRGAADRGEPGFIVLNVIALCPVVTLAIDHARRRASARRARSSGV